MTVGNFSTAPADSLRDAIGKGYCGVHVEQGVPVLDRDLNLLGDLISAAVQRALRLHVGDGTARSKDFLIQPTITDPLDLLITAGTFLAGGLVVTLSADATYKTQPAPSTAAPALPALTSQTAGQPDPRRDIVCLDAWLDDVDESVDASLGNPLDVGMRTSTRIAPRCVVRVFENADVLPPPPAGHAYVALAQLSRAAAAGPPVVTDLRNTRLAIAEMARRLTVIESAFQPIISTIAPSHVLPGQSNPIIITGRNLDFGFVNVLLGTTPGVVIPPTSPTSLMVAVPANAAPGSNLKLTLTTALGIAVAPVPLVIEAPLPAPAFVDKSGPTPQIPPQIAPLHALTGSQIVLNGLHFTGVNRVAFNGPQVIYVVPDQANVTDTTIKVTVPDALSTAVGASMSITVSVDGVAGAAVTSDQLFRVDPPPIKQPTFGGTGQQITTIPTTNPVRQSRGSVVTLNGRDFGSPATTSVRFKGNARPVLALPTDIVSVTDTTIQVRVPVALTVDAAPKNQCQITVIVQGVESLPSNDLLTVV